MKKLLIIAAIALVSCNYKSRVNGKPIRHDTVFVYVHDTILVYVHDTIRTYKTLSNLHQGPTIYIDQH